MLSMVIVEDERFERESLINDVDWALIGVQVVGDAMNGLQGLNRVIELRPDIVLTDVRMPSMDGIEMAQKIRLINADTKILFLSAYDDFEYAKQAVNLNAFAYITKPVNEAELLETTKRATDEITKRMLEKSMMNKIKRNYRISLSLARQAVVNQLLTGVQSNRGEAEGLGLGWLYNSSHLCMLLGIYEKEKAPKVIGSIAAFNQKCAALYDCSINICINAGLMVTLVSSSAPLDQALVEPIKQLLSDYFGALGMKDARIESVYENGECVSAGGLYAKLIQRSTGYQPESFQWPRSKIKQQIIGDIERIIRAEYAMPLSIESIAKMIHFTPNYIGTIFKTEKKISINRYLHNVRFEKAEELLRDASLQIGDIALRCGYENSTYFHAMFKKAYGMTPSEYRNSVLVQEQPK